MQGSRLLRVGCRAVVLGAVGLFCLNPAGAAKIKKEKDRKRAPEFELTDSSGKPVRLADFKGKVLLLDFWATWCGPCKTEIPWFVEFAEKYKDQGLAVVGISMDEDGWSVVKPFMEKMEINYPVVLGSKRTAYLYGDIDGLPVTFLIDHEQKVAVVHAGLFKKKELERAIQELLASGSKGDASQQVTENR